MTVSKFKGALSFKRAGADKCSFTATLKAVPALQSLRDTPLRVDVGGVLETFALTDKAKGASAAGQVRLKLKTTRDKSTGQRSFSGGDIAVSISLKKGSWASNWQDEGALNATTAAELSYAIDIGFKGNVYHATVPVRYSAKAGSSGKLKQ